jgi:hypothetical protein
MRSAQCAPAMYAQSSRRHSVRRSLPLRCWRRCPRTLEKATCAFADWLMAFTSTAESIRHLGLVLPGPGAKVRQAQSKPAIFACSTPSASSRSTASRASAACWPLRNVPSERKRVVPYPGRYGRITQQPAGLQDRRPAQRPRMRRLGLRRRFACRRSCRRDHLEDHVGHDPRLRGFAGTTTFTSWSVAASCDELS